MKRLLDVNLRDDTEATVEEQIPLVQKIGFDGIFASYSSDERMQKISSRCKEYGLGFSSVHAPFTGVDAVWREGEEGEYALSSMIKSLESTAKIGVPVLVCHVYIGFGKNESPTRLGVDRFSRLVRRARQLGVTLAFENTEGEEFLATLMHEFKGEEVGFCWDSGHEHCYGKGKDFLSLYGDRLSYVHLNDNLGLLNPSGEITSFDDLHLRPFDGTLDWEKAMRKLSATGYNGSLSFEIKRKNKRGYGEVLPLETFLSTTYERARRVADLLEE